MGKGYVCVSEGGDAAILDVIESRMGMSQFQDCGRGSSLPSKHFRERPANATKPLPTWISHNSGGVWYGKSVPRRPSLPYIGP